MAYALTTWLDPFVDISSECTVGASATVDVSDDGVPVSADFAILAVIGGDSNVDDIRFWKVGGSHSGANPNINKDGLFYVMVPLVNGAFMCYRSHTSIAVHLLGYGTGGTWPNGKTETTPGVAASWQDMDISAQIADAGLGLFELYSVNGFIIGLRKKGSTDDIKTSVYPHSWGFAGCDNSGVAQGYHYSSNERIWVFGGFDKYSGLNIQTNWPELTFSAYGSWVEVDASSHINSGHRTLIVAVSLRYTGDRFGVRKKGSAITWVGGGQQLNFGIVELDADGKFEAFLTQGDSKMYVVASMYGATLPDRVYVWLGDESSKEKFELTDPNNSGSRGVLTARTEIGWDEELQEATAGLAFITADNHLGDYSPEKAAGFWYGDLDLGKRITVYEIYLGVQYNHFTGRIDSIIPHAEHDNQVAFIQAVDGMDDLNQVDINTVLRIDTDVGELADDILDAANWPAGNRDIDAGSDVLQFGWFHKAKALPAFRLLEKTEFGRFWIKPNGDARLENRHARLSGDGLISQHDFEDTMVELPYGYTKRLVKNIVTVRGQRYYADGVQLFSGYDLATIEEGLIWSAHAGDVGAPYIPQNTSLTLWAEFNAPLASYDTLASGTHWNANTAADKTGTDVSANISLVQTQYGQAVKLVFTNGGSQGAFLVAPDSPPLGAPSDRTVLVYGVLYAVEVMAITKEDGTSQDDYGTRSLEVDARFKSNPNDILSYSEFLLAQYKNAVPRASEVKHDARTAWPDDTIRIQCLTRHISDRITMKSTLLGFDQDYFINKVVQEYILLQGGMAHETTWSVERVYGAYEGAFWILGQVGYSEIGETTTLGF